MSKAQNYGSPRSYDRPMIGSTKMSMVEEAKNSIYVGDDVGHSISWCPSGVDNKHAFSIAMFTPYERRRASAAPSLRPERGGSSFQWDGRSKSMGSSFDSAAEHDRILAVNFLVQDSIQFRFFQSQIRSAGTLTDAGTRRVVHSLIDYQMKEMRRLQEWRMRQLREQSLASPPSDCEDQGRRVKTDLWGALRQAQQGLFAHARSSFADEVRSTESEIRGGGEFELKDASLSSLACGSFGNDCYCKNEEECHHFDSTGWKRIAAARGGGVDREVRKVQRDSLSLSPFSSPGRRQLVHVARGA